MRKKKFIFFVMLIFSLFLVLGCEKLKGDKLGNKELVRVNDISISLEEFHTMSEGQPLEGKMRLLDEKGQKDFLDHYVITREVLYQEAKKKGYDKDKTIVAKVENFRKAMIIDALLEEALRGKDEVSDSEVRQYYKEHEDDFTEPVEVKIRHIFVTAESALRDVLAKLKEGENFAALASAYNVDKSREDGGNLGYIKRGQLSSLFAQFEDAAFSLSKKGDLSPVIKTPYGYHIIQLEDRRGKFLRPFEQVKDKLRLFLQAKKRQEAYLEYVKGAKSRAKILVNETLWAEEEKKELKSQGIKK